MGLPYCDVRKFSIIDGLAANTISDIAQTPDRLMWFSTWNGISYYDGNSFHTFRDDADDIDLLSTNRFMGIYATARNNVWCITSSRRLYAYETILCTFVPVGDNINKLYNIDLRVDKIYPIKHDNTWVTTQSRHSLKKLTNAFGLLNSLLANCEILFLFAKLLFKRLSNFFKLAVINDIWVKIFFFLHIYISYMF